MIPDLDNRGLLPAGVHDGTLDEIAIRFCTNATREVLFPRFRQFLVDVLQPLGDGLDLYVTGSFLSDRVLPGDVDCTIDIPCNEVAKRLPLLDLFNDGRDPRRGIKGKIWDDWKVDIHPSLQLPGCNDFVQFFQYVGEKAAAAKNLQVKDLRGIVKVTAWTRG